MLKDWRHTPATRRILAHGSLAKTHLDFVIDACEWLRARGLPLYRTNLYTPTLHPLMQGVGCIWRRDGQHQEQVQPHWGESGDEAHWLESPLRKVLSEIDELRLDLTSAPECQEVPLLAELRAEGVTEYLVYGVPYADGRRSAVSWATDAPAGFSLRERNELRNLAGPMGLVLDLLEWRRTARTLLDTYLGRGPGEAVLAGAIRRGDHRDLDAVMLLTDLRASTALSADLSVESYLAALDSYFEVLIEAISRAGGDVLQFRGDGLLAVFPHPPGPSGRAVCAQVLAADRMARRQMAIVNQRRAASGSPALDFCTALHIGRVTYGNIGGPGRLDFTIVGQAVNLLSRIESLCKTTGHRLLASGEFARRLDAGMTSVGAFPLRGIDQPIELFTLPPDAADAAPRQADSDRS